jgi:hypothetical protein
MIALMARLGAGPAALPPSALMLDERSDLSFEIAGQEAVFETYAVLKCPVLGCVYIHGSHLCNFLIQASCCMEVRMDGSTGIE